MPGSSTDALCEPSGTDKPVRYMITTKRGTSEETFHRLTKEVDGDKGIKRFDYDDQTYITDITYEAAKKAAKNDCVEYVILNSALKLDSHIAYEDKELNDGTGLWKRDILSQPLRILSSPPDMLGDHNNGEWPEYKFDPTLGRDQTIYILDKGFRFDHEELIGTRAKGTYVVPNRYTLSDVHFSQWPAEKDYTDYDGHGTAVASVAAGQTCGVASNANLILVKVTQTHLKKPNDPNDRSMADMDSRSLHREALQDAWEFIVKNVRAKRPHDRRRAGNMKHSIVLMAGGLHYTPYLNALMNKLLKKCWDNDIITVVSAGNDGRKGSSIDAQLPQRLGRTDNPLITVGRVTEKGVLWDQTSLDRGLGGSISVYAVAENVPVAFYMHKGAKTTEEGTSFAAPAVAGLAAYFASLPSLARHFNPGAVAMDMKNYIVSHAVKRAEIPIPPTVPVAYNNPPFAIVDGEKVKVAYNRAPSGLTASNEGSDPAPGTNTLEEGTASGSGAYGSASGSGGQGPVPMQFHSVKTTARKESRKEGSKSGTKPADARTGGSRSQGRGNGNGDTSGKRPSVR